MRELNSRFLFAGFALATVIFATGSSHAAMLTYADSASWSAAVAGFTTEIVPDPTPQQYLSFGGGNVSHGYGTYTYSQSTVKSNADSAIFLFNVGNLFSGNPAVISSQNLDVGSEEYVNILIEFSSAVHGFALNYGTFDGEDVTFTLSNGHTFTQGSNNSIYSTSNFAGATDDDAFTSVLVSSTKLESNLFLNNVSFATALAPVPEPSTLALLGLGGIGIGFSKLRRRLASSN